MFDTEESQPSQGTDSGMKVFTLDTVRKNKHKPKHEEHLDPADKPKGTAGPEEPTIFERTRNVWAVIVFAWALYRYIFKTDFPIWVDELVIKPILFISPLHLYITNIEHKKFLDDIWFKRSEIKSDLLFGTIVGGILFLSGAGINAIKHGSLLPPESILLSAPWMVGYFLILALGTSISEEILSRGFLTKRLFLSNNNIILSILMGTFFSFFIRIPILFTTGIEGISLLQVLLTDFIFGLTVSFLYLQNKSISLPIIVHTFYTLSLYIFLR